MVPKAVPILPGEVSLKSRLKYRSNWVHWAGFTDTDPRLARPLLSSSSVLSTFDNSLETANNPNFLLNTIRIISSEDCFCFGDIFLSKVKKSPF